MQAVICSRATLCGQASVFYKTSNIFETVFSRIFYLIIYVFCCMDMTAWLTFHKPICCQGFCLLNLLEINSGVFIWKLIFCVK